MLESVKGLKLGRYEVIKHLASGGMAEVLLAKAAGIEGFERHVVIKRIRGEHAHDPHAIAMFLDEARLAASLHHHNIAQVHDVGKENDQYFFAMEYVHGEDLRTLLRHASEEQHVIPFEHIVGIVSAIAAGLQHAHDQVGPDRTPLAIVHRDVSPGNIIVGYDGGVKLVDFGIAKAAARTAETRSGTIKGKIAYMSVEQCLGQPVDRRSDLFSLGIVLYELTTVRRLFKGANDYLTMTAIVNGDIPPPSIYRKDLPASLETIIMKSLALDPAKRYQDANELRGAVDGFAAAHDLRPSPAKLAEYMEERFGRRLEPWLVDDDTVLQVRDFDETGPGLAAIAPDVEVTATEGSPFARMRRRDTTSPPLSSDEDTKPAEHAQTPMGWSKDAGPKRTRNKLWVAGAAAAVALAIMLVVVAGRGGDPDDTAPPPISSSVEPPAPHPPPPPPPPPSPDIKIVAPSRVEEPLRAEADIPTRVTPPPESVRPPTSSSTTQRKRWDPNKLLPK